MAFSDFKNIAQVQEQYRVKYREERFIAAPEMTPPENFLADFTFYQNNLDVFSSEAARSEVVISPLLRETYKLHHEKCSFWIQRSISYDGVLTGTPDYIFSSKSELGKTVLEKPLLIVVEAKKNDFEQGWGQCLAELVAAQKINGDFTRPVYGIVTDANLWQFGKLAEDVFVRDPENFTVDKLNRLYGALNYLVSVAEYSP
jgi:hypothetical protein